MLEGGIIAKLLDEKWSTFAKVVSMSHQHDTETEPNKIEQTMSELLIWALPKIIFIGPESDHWLCLSVTPSLTH